MTSFRSIPGERTAERLGSRLKPRTQSGVSPSSLVDLVSMIPAKRRRREAEQALSAAE
jgi:hypothetical protein